MKKVLILLLMLTSLIIIPSNVKAESDKITVYLFRGDTCVHCEDALEYINNHRELIPDNVEIVTYEVWKNETNANLQDAVADYLDVDKTAKDYGTPFFVVGSEYVKGYGTGTWEELFEIVEDYEKEGDYEDIVSKVISDEKLDVEAKTLNDLYSEPSKAVTIIVYCVFGAIVLGFIAMIAFSRK